MTYTIEYFLGLEKELLVKELESKTIVGSVDSDGQLEKIINDFFKVIHAKLENSLMNLYMINACPGYEVKLFSEVLEGDLNEDVVLPFDLEIASLPRICELLHIYYLNTQFAYSNGKLVRKKSKNNLLEAGAVYTQDNIAYDIVYRTLKNLSVNTSDSLKVLDFATGTGRFYRQIVKCMDELYNLAPDFSVLNNIYAIDIDPIAINVCRVNALSFLDSVDIAKARTVAKHIILKNALIKENTTTCTLECVEDIFPVVFDAIVSNPPYLVLKPNKKKMDQETIDSICGMVKYFRTSNDYKYSIEGMLNLYQLSLESMLGMLREGGEMGIICPSTLFADISAATLRKHMLSKHNVTYIKYFSEDEPLFDNVTQATCIFHLTKGEECKVINIVQGNKNYRISLDDVQHVFSSNWEIPPIDQVEWDILRKLLKVQKLKDCSDIRNKRGELDVSLHKEYITNEETPYRLVRGNMIIDRRLNDINHEYVNPDFLAIKSQDYLLNDSGRVRLVGQNIANMKQRVRLNFVECEKNDILGNSCNYISVSDDHIQKMKLLLNSALLNWRFKITSTNNHVNNYELDELPIIDFDSITPELMEMDEVEQNIKLCVLYGLTTNEVDFIIKNQYETI